MASATSVASLVCSSIICFTMSIASRIKAVRNESGLNQLEFSKCIGITRQYLSLIESDDRTPSDIVKKAICREWLEDGIEPMHPTQELSDIALITRAMEGQNENKKELIRMLANMPDELLEKFVENLKTYLL